jgi:hypothetical protein
MTLSTCDAPRRDLPRLARVACADCGVSPASVRWGGALTPAVRRVPSRGADPDVGGRQFVRVPVQGYNTPEHVGALRDALSTLLVNRDRSRVRDLPHAAIDWTRARAASDADDHRDLRSLRAHFPQPVLNLPGVERSTCRLELG